MKRSPVRCPPVGTDRRRCRSIAHPRAHSALQYFRACLAARQDLDLAQLIMQIHKPPVRKLGVFDVDTFFPEKERFALSVLFNNILAAPSFQTWIEGTPLDIDVITRGSGDKPRCAIFYIAHLSDQERMFFVALLLEQVRTWCADNRVRLPCVH